MILPNKVEQVKKFENQFGTMFRTGALTVTTVGFHIHPDGDGIDKTWKNNDELFSIFNPLHAWIGNANNLSIFKKEYSNIMPESYSWFEGGGFIPVAVIPAHMIKMLKNK